MAQTENPGRARILARLRAALQTPAPGHSSSARRPIFAPVADALERFQKECAENKTECLVVADLAAGGAAVAGVLDALPAGEIFVQDAPDLRVLAPTWEKARRLRWSSEGGPAEASQATVTKAEALVALTGSLLTSAGCGGRGASVVAPVHIVVATLEQLVPDLEAAFTRVRESGLVARNSYLCLITGSSRTADIEKILVLGAHGPRRLVVVLALRSP